MVFEGFVHHLKMSLLNFKQADRYSGKRAESTASTFLNK